MPEVERWDVPPVRARNERIYLLRSHVLGFDKLDRGVHEHRDRGGGAFRGSRCGGFDASILSSDAGRQLFATAVTERIAGGKEKIARESRELFALTVCSSGLA